jgi:hypothetical protein
MYDVVATSCYPERVWNGLQVLRSEISRQLGRFSEKQGTYTKTSSQVVLGREAWSYLLSKVATAIRPPIRRHTSAAKRVLESGLELKSLKQGFSSLFVRFETEEELRVLSTVLGELITMEVRKRRPKYKVVESLHLNDIINVVAGSEAREEPFVFRTVKQGIDFIFDGIQVRIKIRYQRFQYALPLATRSPSTLLSRGIERKRLLAAGESDSSDDEVLVANLPPEIVAKVGREFEFSGRVYQVQSINKVARTVAAKVMWPVNMNAQVHSFALDDVDQWIEDRLRQQFAFG